RVDRSHFGSGSLEKKQRYSCRASSGRSFLRSVWLLGLLLATTAAMGSAQVSKPRFRDLAREFDYDAKQPLDVRELKQERRADATIIDLTYASPRGGRVPAYLVLPNGKGRFPVVLFGHWMMPGSPQRNRSEFLDEAVALASAGVISLLIDAPLVRPGMVEEKEDLRSAAQGSEAARQQVIDFRRGLDLLTARADVDPRRIAYVGHSFHAHVGGILSAVEKRIGSFVLMAGGYAVEEYVFDPDIPEMRKLRARIGDEKIRDHFRKYAWDDPVYFVGHSAPAAVFLQFGRLDQPIPPRLALRWFQLFGDPKRIAFYESGHALDAKARRDRAEWLRRRLSFGRVDQAALARIPELK
ncbi:MAG: alpha/beta hydrolase family protein, partial [Pyrinomonadaceae bacterium]